MTLSISDINYAFPTPETVRNLCKQEGGLRISLYLPVPMEPPESDKNPVVLKNLLRKVRERLDANGAGPGTADDILGPLDDLVAHPKQLLKGNPALAFFISGDSFSVFRLPYPVEARAEVGNRYFVKPLMDLLSLSVPVTVACLNRGHVRILRGTPLHLEEIEVEGMPRTLTDVTGIDDPEKSIQQHTGKVGSAKGRPGASPVMQTHGQGLPADYKHSQLKRFFTEVAKCLEHNLAGRPDAVVAFGIEKNIGFFKAAFDGGNRIVHMVNEDPQSWHASELKERTSAVLEPERRKAEAANLNELESLRQRSEGLFTVKETALAAAAGRIELAAVAGDDRVPGICNPDTMSVDLLDNSEPGCADDLLDYIAYEAIRHGGTVFCAPHDAVPGEKGVAAKTRF